jgi:hypothetical protein
MTGAFRVSLRVADIFALLACRALGCLRCYNVKLSSLLANDELFPVEHSGHHPPSETIDDQQSGGDPSANPSVRVITLSDINAHGGSPRPVRPRSISKSRES